MAKTGKITWYSEAKGNGNIRADSGEEFFFDLNSLLSRSDQFQIEVGRKVQFEDSGRFLSTQNMKKAAQVQLI
ncbi:MAG: hypothetical protein R3C62_02290 [Chloroflexota bacterium]